MKATLGERLYELRSNLGLSLYDVADIIGVSETSIWQWESNITFPRAKNIDKLCRYFGVTVDYLMGYSDTKRPVPMKIADVLQEEDEDDDYFPNTKFIKTLKQLESKLSKRDKKLIIALANSMILNSPKQ